MLSVHSTHTFLATSPTLFNYLKDNISSDPIKVDPRLLALVSHYLGCEDVPSTVLKYISLEYFFEMSVLDIFQPVTDDSSLRNEAITSIARTLATGFRKGIIIAPPDLSQELLDDLLSSAEN
jgi:hypothetical protein